jgi:copper transport protein
VRLKRAALAAFGAMLLIGPPSAHAHAVLVGSEPSERAIVADPPRQIRLFFSEPVDPEFFGADVYDAAGQRVDLGDARISASDVRTLEVGLGDLPSGTYLVVWHVVSLDSHPVRDSFPFSVGVGTVPVPISLAQPAVGAPASLETVVRWLTDVAALLLLGGLAFPPLVMSRAIYRTAANKGWLALAWSGVVCLLVLTFVSLLAQAAAAAAVPVQDVLSSHAVSRTLQTRFGVLLMVRQVLTLCLAAVLAAIGATAARDLRLAWSVGAVLGGAIVLTIAASGHAATAEPVALAVAVDCLHLIAAGLWLGGLVQLVLLPRNPRPNGILARFSRVALLSTAILVGSGLWNTLEQVAPAGWQALTDTTYGAVLSAKLIALVPVFGLAAGNWLLVQRGRAARPRLVQRLVMGEVTLVLAVVGITAVLVGQPPSVSIPLAARPFRETRQNPDGTVALSVSPNQAGDNRLSVSLADPGGRPVVDPGASVHLALTMLEMEMGTRELDPAADGRGNFVLSGGYLSMPGRWRADVRINRPQASPVTDQFNLLVGQAPGVSRPSFSPAYILYLAVTDPDRPQNAAPLNPLFVATASCFAALLFAVVVGRRHRALGHAAVALGLTGTLLFGGVSLAQAFRKSLPDPVPADSASLDRGRAEYQRCVACHGVAGRGDGPAGRTLNPRPADFRVHMAAGHTDRQLFDWISKGIDGTAMPAFGDQLTEQDRWDVINYIRTFAAQ